VSEATDSSGPSEASVNDTSGTAGKVAVTPATRPAIGKGFRLQWENAQVAYVLLYPEGMIKLNTSAGEILRRCNGESTVGEITADLEKAFSTRGLEADVIAFVAMAREKHWVVLS
jgi:pyrroloquinoline quinone biosynthesis protein D